MKLKLRELRKARGVTQKQISQETGIAHSTLSLIERGKREPEVGTLQTLAGYFGVTLAELLGEGPASLAPKATGPAGMVGQLLLAGPGHAYLLQPVEDLRAEAVGMSVPAILVRMQDLAAENSYLKAVKFKDYPADAQATHQQLKATQRAIKEARRGFVGRLMVLIGVAESKVADAQLSEEELEQATADIERGAAQALVEANAPA